MREDFCPGVDDISNRILATRGTRRAEKLWSHRFSKRREERKTRFSRAYDFQRALCEDSDVISAWSRDADTHWPPYCGCRLLGLPGTTQPTEALSQSMIVQTRVINY